MSSSLFSDPRLIAKKARALADDLDRLLINGSPSPAALDGAPTLHFWARAVAPSSALIGVVHGHPLIKGGRVSVTSNLFALDPAGNWARTWSRWYRLQDQAPASLYSLNSKDGALQ